MRINRRKVRPLPPPTLSPPEEEYTRSKIGEEFVKECERRLLIMGLAQPGTGIDTNELETGFSIDSAFDAYNMGLSVEQYLTGVMTRRQRLRRKVV